MISEEKLWKLPNWLFAAGFLIATVIVAVHYARGGALMCANGAILANPCNESQTIEEAALQAKQLILGDPAAVRLLQGPKGEAGVAPSAQDIANSLDLSALDLSGAGGPSAAEVAQVLARDYGDRLQGPEGPAGPRGERGPQGEQGPQGPAGDASGSTAVGPTTPELLQNFTFSSDFQTKRIGNLQVDLVGCRNGGSSVSCEFQVEWLGDKIVDISHSSESFKIALETSEWHRGDLLTLLNKSASYRFSHDFIPNLPVRMTVDFQGAETNGTGLPIVQYCTYSCKSEATWQNVAFIDE